METNSTQTLGREARRLRREAGLTQIDLALLAGVGRRFVSEFESGRKTSLRIDKVDAVFRVLGKRLGVVDLENESVSLG
jgi:transcriptional regulator with XRE-family HTH domain